MNRILVAAIDEENGLGYDGKLLYEFPEDLSRFKRLTENRVLLCGRKTFEGLPRVLPGRPHVVLSATGEITPRSNDGEWHAVRNLDDAFLVAQSIAAREGRNGIAVIGGADVYRQCLPLVDTCYITHIRSVRPSDTHFPIEVLAKYFEPVDGQDFENFDFTTYRKFEWG